MTAPGVRPGRGWRLGGDARFSAAVALWLSLEWVALGPFSHVRNHDTGDHMAPRDILLVSAAYQARSHDWLPHIACGIDRLGTGLAERHLTSILNFLFPAWLALGTLRLGQAFLGCLFVMRIARERLGLSPLAAALAGAAFAVTADGASGNQGSFLLLPVYAWYLEELGRRRGTGALALALGLGLCNSVASTAAQTLPFQLIALAFWLAAARRAVSWRTAAVFLVFCAGSILPHRTTVLAQMLQAPLSQRTMWPASNPVGWEALGKSLASLMDYWPVLALALPGLLRGRARGALWAGLLFCLVGAWLLDAGRAAASAHIGFLRGLQVTRLEKTAPFFAALLGGCAVDALPRPRVAAALWAAVLAWGTLREKVSSAEDWFFQGGYHANYASPVLRDLAARHPPGTFRVATFTHGLHPAYANVYGLESVDGYIQVYPLRYHRFWSKVIEPLTRREPKYDEYFNRWGSRIYLFFETVDPFPGGVPLERYYRMNLLSLANTRYLVSRHPLLHPDLRPLLVQRPWREMDRWERARLRLRENFTGKTYLYLYENQAALPRAYFARRLEPAPGPEAALQRAAEASVAELRRTVWVEGGIAGAAALAEGEVRLENYEPDRIEFAASMKGPGLLVVTNSYSPYWTCRADGREVRIVPAYGVFWGVFLDRPARRIVFRYAPPYRGRVGGA